MLLYNVENIDNPRLIKVNTIPIDKIYDKSLTFLSSLHEENNLSITSLYKYSPSSLLIGRQFIITNPNATSLIQNRNCSMISKKMTDLFENHDHLGSTELNPIGIEPEDINNDFSPFSKVNK